MLLNKKNPEIEIGRNSSLYFALGLNLMLFLSWQLLEYKTFEKDEVDIGVVNIEAQVEEDIPIVHMDKLPPPPPPPPAIMTESIEIVENEEVVEETVFESTETSQEESIVEYEVVDVGDVQVEEMEEEVEVAFAVIENVPIYPGCEGLSREKAKACFQEKVQEHIITHFKYPEAALEMGIQGRVSVMFIVDAQGYIIGVKSRGPDKILEAEAERIIKLLPKMQPGKQRGRPVKVMYAVPIFFKFREG